MRGSAPTISVVVPTYRRGEYLTRCLDAVAAQTHTPDEVIVVRREDDAETAAVLAARPEVEEVVVNRPGNVAAMVAGVRRASGHLLAFTDDDAVPRADWLERLVPHLQDPSVGGAGGRDLVHTPHDSVRPLTEDVGRVTSWGKLVGNHHLGAGPPRHVTVLKGANMLFRRECFALPDGLRGAGTQMHWEVATSLFAVSQGWRLIYDPGIVVDHYAGPRFAGEWRSGHEQGAIADIAYNLVATLSAFAPRSRLRRALYGLTVGDRACPGLARAAVAAARGERDVVRALKPSLRGQTEALADYARGRRIRLVHFVDPDGDRDGRPRPCVALIAHDIHDRGGMERAFAELVRRGRAHADFVVVSGTLAPDLRGLVEWRRVRVPRRPFPLKFVLFYVQAATVVAGLPADVRHAMGAIVPNTLDMASVQFCHAGFRDAARRTPLGRASALRRLNTGMARALALAAERRSYRPRRVETLAAVSDAVAAELCRHYPGTNIVVTPNGVDRTRFQPSARARRNVRREQDVTDDEVIAIFVGGDWYRKGLDLAIAALPFAIAAAARPLRLWVIGRGDINRFTDLAARSGVADRVHFLGARRDTARYLQAADVFVFPTAYEAMALAVLEAAACALPLVVTRAIGADELLDDECAVVVERTGSSIGAALARLANDAELRGRMGSAARHRSSRYTWEDSVSRVVRVYEHAWRPTRHAVEVAT